jgi:NAD(P)-dependent dehydrogenase (short-subunit alcohol dehydrogenase family)
MQTPTFRLDGKVALLTGSGRGIGLAMARALASVGCAVAIQDIDEPVARAEADRINAEGGRAISLSGDLTDLTLPPRLVADTVARLGGLHILVNNGAIQEHRHWLEYSIEDMRKQFDADLYAPLLFCQLAAPIFKRQRWGRIINLGSIQQLRGNEYMLPYSLSKAGLEKLTCALARDLGPDNVTVNLIAPGWFDTYRNREHFKTDEDRVRLGKGLPAGRIGQPDDVAGLALLLCSDAGSYITGQSIHIDGGMSA